MNEGARDPDAVVLLGLPPENLVADRYDLDTSVHLGITCGSGRQLRAELYGPICNDFCPCRSGKLPLSDRTQTENSMAPIELRRQGDAHL
jgi:hypothetical protein